MTDKLSLSERIELYKFFATVGFSGVVALFCMFQLAWHPNTRKSQNESAYFGLLGTCIALWVNPTGTSRRENNFAVDSQQTTIVASREQGE